MGSCEGRPGVNSLQLMIVSSIQTERVPRRLWKLSPISKEPLYPLAQDGFANEPAAWQLRTLFRSYPPKLQDEFRDAVVLAVSNYSLERQGPGVLMKLSWLVADTRALEAIKPLCGLVETDLIANRNQEEFQDSLRAAMGVIVGSAKFDETRNIVKETAERWFVDPTYERYSAMLLNGLCRCSPENYAQYFPRFLDVARMHPDYFDLDFVVAEMIRIVSPQIISEHLDALPLETRELLESKFQT